MRQTGRTTRIVDFAVQQLFSVGEVVVTDHYMFECPKSRREPLLHFIEKVRERVQRESNGKFIIVPTIIQLQRGSDLHVVHFKMKHNIFNNTRLGDFLKENCVKSFFKKRRDDGGKTWYIEYETAFVKTSFTYTSESDRDYDWNLIYSDSH